MADQVEDPVRKEDSLDSRQKVLAELSLIVFGFMALPLLQGIINNLQTHPLPTARPGSPLALLGQSWNLGLLTWLVFNSPVRLKLPREIWRISGSCLIKSLALCAAMVGLAGLLGLGLPAPSAGAMPFSPSSSPLLLSGIILSLILAVGQEELLYRLYLLERLGSLGANPVVSIGISTCLFALAHQYQGLTGLVLSLALGGLLALAWWRWRNYWVNFFAHLLYNLIVLAGSFF